MKIFGRSYHKPDYKFIITLAAIVAFGLIMLSSASVAISFNKFQDNYYYLKHQLVNGFLPGLFFLILFSIIDYRFWRKIAFYLLVLTIVLLVAVFLPHVGANYGTANSWINIFGLSFQPSELAKLTFLIYLAAWLENREEKKVSHVSEGLIPFLIILGLIAILLFLQPDLGTMTIIVAFSLAVYFAGGANILHVLGLITAALLSIIGLAKIAPYRAARLTVFLHPELDPQGIGYHINQAFLAIGSGGFWGRGFGMSRQKFQYLPEVEGDSIFAIIAEEMGWIVSSLLIFAYVYLAYRGFKIAESSPDKFAKMFTVGVISWIIIQTFVNIGAMVGLLPLTGVPLPFVSYGGTALVVLMAACGIVINISRQTRE
ncbi:MAG: putative lipid II flippase FtsW [Patescibacteria group bacterium]|nr:putative lipid II flippase FtsW [Patescibacteria group bacterium]